MQQPDLFGAPEEAPPDLPDKGIGGSEVAAIFHLHPGLSAGDLWRRKTDRPVAFERSAAMRRGVALEPIVRWLYGRQTGQEVGAGVRARHARWAEGVAMIAATDGSLPGGRIFEAKTSVFESHRHQLFDQGSVPVEYALQLQHYAATCGASGGVICCLSGPRRPPPWTGEPWQLTAIGWRRIEAVGELLEQAVAGWVTDFVLGDVEPPDHHPDAARLSALLGEPGWLDPPLIWTGDRLDRPPKPSPSAQLALL